MAQNVYPDENYYTRNNDFGPTHMANGFDVSNLLRSYREATIQDAQRRQFLSDCRVLSLSYVFLISPIDKCCIFDLAPEIQTKVLNSFNVPELRHVTQDVYIACRQTFMALMNNNLTNQLVENQLLTTIVNNNDNQDIRTFAHIASYLIGQFREQYGSIQRGEDTFIIDTVRPYLYHCLATKIPHVNFDWLTYPMRQSPDSQIIMPDFVLYTESDTAIYELLFVEVKRRANNLNNDFESDLVKLGKEMQIALNKLIRKRVRNPRIIGLHVVETLVVVYMMDLRYSGQYRMVEIGRFSLARGRVSDVLLLPPAIEILNVVRTIVQETVVNIFTAINGVIDEGNTRTFMRDACRPPVRVEIQEQGTAQG